MVALLRLRRSARPTGAATAGPLLTIGPAQQRIIIHDLAGCREHLASWARVDIARFMSPIGALRT